MSTKSRTEPFEASIATVLLGAAIASYGTGYHTLGVELGVICVLFVTVVRSADVVRLLRRDSNAR